MNSPSAPFRPKQRLAFYTRVPFNHDTGPAQGLREGIELIKIAERLHDQSGWDYQQHFDHYLSARCPFFAAAGQHTTRIELGSAVIRIPDQDAISLAAAAGTTDLLIGGRLDLSISTGANALFGAVFGTVDTDVRMVAERLQPPFLAAISGEVLHTVAEPSFTELRPTSLKQWPQPWTGRIPGDRVAPVSFNSKREEAGLHLAGIAW